MSTLTLTFKPASDGKVALAHETEASFSAKQALSADLLLAAETIFSDDSDDLIGKVGNNEAALIPPAADCDRIIERHSITPHQIAF